MLTSLNNYSTQPQKNSSSIQEQGDQWVILCEGKEHQRNKEYKQAQACYSKIHLENLLQFKYTSSGRCYYETQEYKKAINAYHSIPNWEQDKFVLFNLGTCYEKMENYVQAIQIFQSIPDWKSNETILIAIARIYEKMNQYKKSIETYQSIPNWKENKKILLNLARSYELMGVPHTIQQLFLLVNRIPGEHYLCGDQVIHLIQNYYDQTENNEVKEAKQIDFDFVSSCTNLFEIKKNDFKQNPHIPQLYTKFIAGVGVVELYTICEEKEKKSEHWIKPIALTGDFTICAVFLDAKGALKDPTGRGLNDIRNKQLSMIGDSVTRFHEDPIRLLRAIKYIVKGFKPSPDIEEALYKWQSDKLINKGHIFSIAYKHLKTLTLIQRKKYIENLLRYGLLEKLFQIPNTIGINKAEKLLVSLISKNSFTNNAIKNDQRNMCFFNKNYLSLQLKREPRLALPILELKEFDKNRLDLEALDLAMPRLKKYS